MALGASVGLSWGPALAYFATHVLLARGAGVAFACLGATFAAGVVGARPPESYLRIRAWERAGGGRAYERLAGIRRFKRWMSDGDAMNARLRRLDPSYRVVRASRASLGAYATRTRAIERAHLAWLAGALPPLALAVSAGARGFAAYWVALNLATNVWPIFLQRYNRARAERAAA